MRGMIPSSRVGARRAACSSVNAPCNKTIAVKAPRRGALLTRVAAHESDSLSKVELLRPNPPPALLKTPPSQEALYAEVGEPSTSSAAANDVGAATQNVKKNVPLTPDQIKFKTGDKLAGRVMTASNRGARVQLIDHPGIYGYMPRNRGPYALRDAFARNPYQNELQDAPCMTIGMQREFLVISIPHDMQMHGKGPLVACNDIDISILWKRIFQILEVSTLLRETIRVQVHGASDRGLLVTLSGIKGFVPVSHIPKGKEVWYTQDDLREKFVGQEVEVSLMTADQKRGSFTASMLEAATNRAVRSMKIGSLVWGTVRLLRDYGVFVAIDNTFESALLHISNISWDRVDSISETFAEGDRVRCVVIGMDDGYTRLSVSTKDIEKTAGDMLMDREKVFADAEENVIPFREHVAKWEAEEADRVREEQEWEGGGEQ